MVATWEGIALGLFQRIKGGTCVVKHDNVKLSPTVPVLGDAVSVIEPET